MKRLKKKKIADKTDKTTRRNKSRLVTKEKTLKRYRDRVKQYKQNGTFQYNKRKSYQQVGGESAST